MHDQHNADELLLEEWEAHRLRRIEPPCHTLVLRNRAGHDVDERALADQLARVDGVASLTSLVVDPTSRVGALRFLAALPGLENLQLNGLMLRSLDGLEHCGRGRFIKIDTGKNKARRLDELARAPVIKLSLQWAHESDLRAVGAIPTLRELALAAAPALPFDLWRAAPIESLSVSGGGFEDLSDTGRLPALRKITLLDCRKLGRFSGDNGNVEWMVIQACSGLDLRTIATFRGLKSVALTSVKTEIRLSDFASLPQLRNLSLQRCRIKLDDMRLKSVAPNLERIVLAGVDQRTLNDVSLANAGVLVSNGVRSFRDGLPGGDEGALVEASHPARPRPRHAQRPPHDAVSRRGAEPVARAVGLGRPLRPYKLASPSA